MDEIAGGLLDTVVVGSADTETDMISRMAEGKVVTTASCFCFDSDGTLLSRQLWR